MRDLIARLPLGRAVEVALPATVFLFACGSSAIQEVEDFGRRARWVGLLALLVLAVAWWWSRRRAPSLPAAVYAASGALVGLALVSAAWSVAPRLSLGRAASLAILFVAAAALAEATAGRPDDRRRLVWSLVAGAVAVAFAGLVVLAVAPDQAIQEAYVLSPERYRGFGFNPNTVPMLLAVATPLVLAPALDARSRVERAAAWASLALLAGSIIASGSRGALLGALAGALVLVLVRPGGVGGKALLAGAACALFVAGFFIGQAAKTRPPEPKRQPELRTKLARTETSPVRDAQIFYFRIEDEIGRPPTRENPRPPRTRFGSSGRLQAWSGAIDEALERPALGFGFGTETKVFVDRFYAFNGGTPESSYVGMLLQLGVVGLVLFLAVLATAAIAAVRVLRGDGVARRLGAACAGAVAAGVVIAFVQSYAYSVGNVATVTFWASLFLLAGAGKEALARG